MKDWIWVVEIKDAWGTKSGWSPWEYRPTRARARRTLKRCQEEDSTLECRVVKYVRDPWSLRHPGEN
jgi:hypothetical protein